jgi:hypothetical protein
MPQGLTSLIIGDALSAEMRPAVECLTRCVVAVQYATDVDTAARISRGEGCPPDLCLVCQHWPDEYPRADVERLLGLLPLTRFICAYGAWCASDGRTRDVWPPAVRIPSQLAPARIERELSVVRSENGPLPPTASRDEAYDFDHPDRWKQRPPNATSRVSLHVRDFELARVLKDVLHEAGHDVVAQFGASEAVGRQVAAALWDVDPWSEQTCAEISGFRERSPETAVVVLMGMPTADCVHALQNAGASAVVSKLTPLADVLGTIGVTTRSPGS